MYKNRTAEILYNQMILADGRKVCGASLTIMNTIQSLAAKNQLLGLACAFLCLLEMYDLKASDVLGIAHQIVYCNDDENVIKNFKAIKQFMRDDWDLQYKGR